MTPTFCERNKKSLCLIPIGEMRLNTDGGKRIEEIHLGIRKLVRLFYRRNDQMKPKVLPSILQKMKTLLVLK